jgi:4-hydroxythreonine-4-phosphate dehydrogenase
MTMALPLALTMGEPAGIGGELTLMAWQALHTRGPVFVAIDNAARLRAMATSLGLDVPITVVSDAGEAPDVFSRALPVLDRPLGTPSIPGTLDGRNAAAAIGAIADAVSLTMAGTTAAVVTNPIHKATLKGEGFAHPGHTEFLAELAGDGSIPVMMLAGPELRVVPVTVHIPLRAVPQALTTERIVTVGRITAQALKRDFGLAAPRLFIAGLNPHAGEGGMLGAEDDAVIAPAVAALCAEGIDATGPLSADTMFHAAARTRYDAALCMYHDQALIPIKTIGFDEAVNVTLGLPFVRTSPDHGTALDIAGTGKASPASLIASLELAAAMAGRRREHG